MLFAGGSGIIFIMPLFLDGLVPCAPGSIPAAAVLYSLLKLFCLHAPLIFFAFAVSRILVNDYGFLSRAAATGLIYFLAVAAGSWVVPLRLGWMLGWSALLLITGIVAWRLGPKAAAEAGAERPARGLAERSGTAAAVLLTGAALMSGIYSPHIDHDPMTYQLHFAAEWVKAGRIFIVPAPFGDPSHSYGPQLASTFYVWLMAPLGTDMLAVNGGWFFMLLMLLGASGLSREFGARRGYEWAPAVLALLSPMVLYEGMSALNDIAIAAFFCASLYFLARAARLKTGGDLFLGLLGCGLMAGCKYTALGLAVIMVPLLAIAALRMRGHAWWAWPAGTAAAAVGGGEWYIRNLFLAGNPVFPFRIALGKWTLFAGMYGRKEMLGWVFDKSGIREWLGMVLAAASLPLLLVYAASIIAVIVIAVRALARRDGPSEGPEEWKWRWLAIIYMALVPVLADRLNWDFYPFQVYRFWVPALAAASAVAGAALSRRPLLLFLALAGVVGGFFWMPALSFLGGVVRFWPLTTLVLFLAAAGAAWAMGKFPGLERLALSPAVLGIIGAAAVLALTGAGLMNWEARREASLKTWEYAAGWSRLPCPEAGTTVAYTGANLPYALHGPRLQNTVVYVDTAGRLMPRDHEIWRGLGIERPRFLTPEPIVSRLELCPRQWAEAMTSSGIDYLVVMTVMRNALLNVVHDADGWPVEDSWARRAPAAFHLVCGDKSTRIYRIDAAARSGLAALPATCEARPPDAPTALGESSAECKKFFPLAVDAMKKMKMGEE